LETQETANSQGNAQQKEQCWRYPDGEKSASSTNASGKSGYPSARN
jgi:hypothetical protein